jgi:hypothetical protein
MAEINTASAGRHSAGVRRSKKLSTLMDITEEEKAAVLAQAGSL